MSVGGRGAGYSVLTQTVAGFSSQAIMVRGGVFLEAPVCVRKGGGELGIVF